MALTIYTGASLLAFIACAIFSPFVFFAGRKNRQAHLFSGLTLLAGIWSLFPFVTGQARNEADALSFARLIYSASLFVPPVFLHLTFALLDLPKTKLERLLLVGSYFISVLFLPLLPTEMFIRGVIRFAPFFSVFPGPFYTVFVLFFGVTCAIGFVKLVRGYKQATGIKKNQLRYIFVSWFLAYISGLLHFLPAYFRLEPFPHDFLLFAFVPLSSYAIVRYRLMDINLAITRTAVFTSVYALVVGIPLIVAWGWQAQLREAFGQYWWVGLWVGSSVLSTLAHYVNMHFQKKAEQRLLKEQREYQHTLRQAAQGMTLVKDLPKLLNFIVHVLTRTVKVEYSGLWLLELRRRKYALKASRGAKGSQAGDTIDFTHVLVLYLLKEKRSIVQEELRLLIQDERWNYLKPVVNELERIGAAVLIPSFERAKLVGFLVLSEKKSGKLYTSDDLEVFEVLASQAALAIENAQFYEELKRAQADLFQTAKMASLGHMAGGMSHQVNNRFHVLSILAGTMKATLKDNDPTRLEPAKLKQLWDKTLEVFTKVEENALRGGDIVKTILKFSRPSGDYLPVELPKVISTALEVVQFRVNFATLDLVQSFPEGLAPVKGDLNQLADCCFNLISNTYDATQRKVELIAQGKLTLSPNDSDPYRAKISITAKELTEKGKKWVGLQVQDNGVGMTPQELDNLFIPFFTTKATAQKGTGLGLYIIQRIIEQHGGSIHATSDYGVGTTFTIKLPAARE